MVSVNGLQYSAADFTKFAKQYGFTHVTSSPKYPQVNGEAERAVRTVKELLKKNDDPYLAMLAYQSTPLENGYSPAEVLMGRRLCTTIPMIKKQLTPTLPKGSKLQKREEKMRQQQKQNFDKHHRAEELKPLAKGDKVWISDTKSWGTVQKESHTRSYIVISDSGGTYQRNRRHLVQLPQDGDESGQPVPPARHSAEPSTEESGSPKVHIIMATHKTTTIQLISLCKEEKSHLYLVPRRVLLPGELGWSGVEESLDSGLLGIETVFKKRLVHINCHSLIHWSY